ncbi:MAG: hypothetical protein GX247_02340 [Mollicutes bacterium]|mgnify:CR=1 FL=1|jgi:hypothetical protein|nr:hypothetical protein [Mollicutes bacterium]
MGKNKKNEGQKVEFDLFTLSLAELIKVYENINEFLEFLEDKKIPMEEKVGNQDE